MQPILTLLATLLLAPLVSLQAADVVNLRCEYLKDPLGIDVAKPRLSWVIDVPPSPITRSVRQTAYQVLVASTPELLAQDKGDLWDSGKVESDQSIQVEYAGKPPESRMKCHWKVRVWDKDGNPSAWSAPSEWTMGLMNPADWSAKWITHGNNGFDGAHWIWFNEGNPASMAPEGTRQFRRCITLPTDRTLTSAKVRLTADNSFILTINGQSAASGNEWAQPIEADITAALKVGDNNLAISATNTVSGAAGLIARFDFTFTSGEPLTVVTDGQWQASTDGSQWSNALSLGTSGIAPWGAVNGANFSHPWLRRTFEMKDDVERAVIHINTASYYELHINGKKVGPYVLEPGITQNNKRFVVNAYDVTSCLVKGTNTIALWMGPGWHQPRNGNTYNAPILRAQLSAVTPSGPMEIGTDASWRVKESCISQIGGWMWNDFGGEHFDAREFLEDWDQVGLDDSQWVGAREIPAPQVVHSWQACEPARLGEPVKPVEIRRLQNGKWVIDFGRPLTGWLRLQMHDLKAGQEVQIQYADIDDNRNARKLAFMVNADGFQDFNQKDVFISAGKGTETFCSRFNFHSFRYAVIAGLAREPSVSDAEAMMIEPDLSSAGSFECSNELFNRIHEITRYTLRTQNPCLALGTGEAREKAAYGDGGAHLSGYLYNFKCDANLKKWILDWSDAQRDDGWFHHTAPSFEDHGGGPAWGGQVSELVRRMHLYYGDRGVVEQMVDKLRKYVDFLESKTRDDILRSYTPTTRGDDMMFIGDWARPAATAGQGFNMDHTNEREFFNNSYRVLLWQQLQDFAASIGRTDEARRCGERLAILRPLVHKEFYQQDKGNYRYSSQSSLAMALYARVPPPELRPKIMAQLENMIVVEKQGHLDTGLLGTFILLDLLIQENRNDLVGLIMNQTTYPGWGYLIKELGLKTWPETWSGWGSHVILVTATPGSWFYEGLAGILPDPMNPGFKHFTLRPGIVTSVDWVKCGYQSPYGKIVSNWKREGDKLTMEVTIPANTTATVFVPARDAASVTESGKPANKATDLKFIRFENSVAAFELGSGAYQFQSTIP